MTVKEFLEWREKKARASGRDIRSTRGGFQMHCVVYHALSLVQDRIEQTKTYRPCLQYLIETAEKENDIRFAPELKKEMGLT